MSTNQRKSPLTAEQTSSSGPPSLISGANPPAAAVSVTPQAAMAATMSAEVVASAPVGGMPNNMTVPRYPVMNSSVPTTAMPLGGINVQQQQSSLLPPNVPFPFSNIPPPGE